MLLLVRILIHLLLFGLAGVVFVFGVGIGLAASAFWGSVLWIIAGLLALLNLLWIIVSILSSGRQR